MADPSKEKGPQRRKVWHPKVKTGCITCKARRVKCSEERPYCHRCKKTGIKCEGYPQNPKSQPPKAAREPQSPKHSQVPAKSLFQSKEDASGFRFTVQTLSIRLQFYSCSKLWDSIIPQASHDYLAVKHAMLALGTQQLAIEQLGQDVPPAWANSLRVTSMKHYSQAIKELVSNPPPIDAILLACLLFTVFDNRFIFKERTHVDAGIRLIEEYRKRNPDKHTPITDLIDEDIAPIFEGFLLQLLAVYQKDTLSAPSRKLSTRRPKPYVPEQLDNGFDAFSSLAGIIMYTIARASDIAAEPRPLTESSGLSLIKSLFLKWSKAFQRFCDSNRFPGSPEENRIRMIKAHQRSLYIILRAFFAGSEVAYDEHMESFEFILMTMRDIIDSPSTMTQPSFTFYTPLFLTATKCRDPTLRRQALKLLRRVHKHELQWNSCSASDVAERLMQLEEREQPNASIPGGRRVSIRTIETGEKCDTLKLGFLTASAKDHKPRLVHATFPWSPCRNVACCGTGDVQFVQTYSRIHIEIELAAYVSAATVPPYIYKMTPNAV